MASTILGPVADTVVTFLQANGFTGYRWARNDYDLPAGVVELPNIGRVELNSQIGTNDWNLSFPVALYFDLSEAVYSQDQAAEQVEKLIKAIDANPSLGDATIVDDAIVSEAVPSFETVGARPVIVYSCTLELTKLVT